MLENFSLQIPNPPMLVLTSPAPSTYLWSSLGRHNLISLRRLATWGKLIPHSFLLQWFFPFSLPVVPVPSSHLLLGAEGPFPLSPPFEPPLHCLLPLASLQAAHIWQDSPISGMPFFCTLAPLFLPRNRNSLRFCFWLSNFTFGETSCIHVFWRTTSTEWLQHLSVLPLPLLKPHFIGVDRFM